MKTLHDDLVTSLQAAVKEAQGLPDVEVRARALASLAQGFSALDMAASQRTLARVAFERDSRERR